MPVTQNISAEEARTIKYLPNNSVLISINEEDMDLHPLKLDRNDSRILTLKFSDVTRPCDVHGIKYNPISSDDALKVLDFINLNKDKNFIVHCHAGISRSAAICLYLHIIHGHELKKHFWRLSCPNKYILGQLMVSRFEKY